MLGLKEWVNLCGILSYLILTVLCETREDLFSYFTNFLIAALAKTTELQFVKKNWCKIETLGDSEMSHKLWNMSHLEDNTLLNLLREHPE